MSQEAARKFHKSIKNKTSTRRPLPSEKEQEEGRGERKGRNDGGVRTCTHFPHDQSGERREWLRKRSEKALKHHLPSVTLPVNRKGTRHRNSRNQKS